MTYFCSGHSGCDAFILSALNLRALGSLFDREL
jgi:hypothetical protein